MKWTVLPLCFLLSVPRPGEAEETRRAWIDLTRDGHSVKIEAFSNLEKGRSGTYRLEMTKVGESGRSTSRQSGAISVSDGTPQGPLTTSRMSVEPSATLEVLFWIEDDTGQRFSDSFDFQAE